METTTSNTAAPSVDVPRLVQRVRVWQGWHKGETGMIIGFTKTLRPQTRIQTPSGKIIELSPFELEYF